MKFIKRLTTIFVTALLLLTMVMSAAGIQYYYDGAYHEYTGNIFKLKVNGKLLNPAMPPIVFNDYSVVPARAVFQDGLGAKVAWDSTNRKVTVSYGETKLVMTIDKTTAVLNGQQVTMPIAPKIINDYTMIPARFVGEKLGMQVDFDSKTDTVLINTEAVKTISVTKASYEKKSDTSSVLTVATDTDTPEYSAFILENPTRLVVDVTNGVFSSVPSVISANAGNLTQIRFGQQASAARIVADLTENLGYSVKTSGKNIIIAITTSGESIPQVTDVFKEISYGYEGGRDYIKFSLEIGEPVKSGSTVTIPVYGSLPAETSEKAVTGFFGTKMTYTPGTGGNGTITVTLKNSEAEVYRQGSEVRLTSVHKALARSVMLDAGHGGQDGGAVAYNEDGSIKAKEKDFNLDIALRAQKLLEAQGVDVHMIRTEDVYVDYLRVGSISNDAGTSLFVSIHTNSATVEQANGIETYGYLEAGSVSNGMTSQRLSTILLEELIEKTGAYKRGVKDGKSLAVINSTKMPATLIEIGFISNEEECEKMMTEAYRQKLAQAVCDGVLRAFDEMGI